MFQERDAGADASRGSACWGCTHTHTHTQHQHTCARRHTRTRACTPGQAQAVRSSPFLSAPPNSQLDESPRGCWNPLCWHPAATSIPSSVHPWGMRPGIPGLVLGRRPSGRAKLLRLQGRACIPAAAQAPGNSPWDAGCLGSPAGSILQAVRSHPWVCTPPPHRARRRHPPCACAHPICAPCLPRPAGQSLGRGSQPH